jgi:hypothetical protein
MINFLKPKLKMQPAVKLSVYGSIDSITIWSNKKINK